MNTYHFFRWTLNKLIFGVFLLSACREDRVPELKNAKCCLVDSFSVSGVPRIFDYVELKYWNDTTFLCIDRLHFRLSYYVKDKHAHNYHFKATRNGNFSKDFPCGYGTDTLRRRILVPGHDRYFYVMDQEFALLEKFDLRPYLREIHYDSISKPWIRRLSPLLLCPEGIILNMELSDTDVAPGKHKQKFLQLRFSNDYDSLLEVSSFYKRPLALKALHNPFFKISQTWSQDSLSGQASHQRLSRYWDHNFLYTGIFHPGNHKTVFFFNYPAADDPVESLQVTPSKQCIMVWDAQHHIESFYELGEEYDDVMLAIKMPNGIAIPLKIDQVNTHNKAVYHLFQF